MTGDGGASSDGVRLQKFLAEAGVASRRKAEELIVAGRVKVNERVVKELGTKVDPARDLVTVDGRLVSRRETKSYYLLYKPSGCVTTASDPEGRPTAIEYLRGVKERVFSVGRLDYDAEGAVLFTDDGELANRLAHPRYGHRRTYLVKVRGEPPAAALERMVAGVRLEDGPARALEVAVHERAERNVWIRIVVAEGRFHLVKRLCEAVGLFVQRLFRPEFGGVTVEGLRPGQFRPLTSVELRAMKAAVGLGGGAPAPASPRELPRAARRHGHGPPAPPEPSSSRRVVPERDAEARPERRPGGNHDVDRRVVDQANRTRLERDPRGGRVEPKRRPAVPWSGEKRPERGHPEREQGGRARGEQERRRTGAPTPRSGAGARGRGPRR
jgi:23S rRNA pseudouridine2605 synthase